MSGGTQQDDEQVLAALADIQADTDTDAAAAAAAAAPVDASPQQGEMPFALVYGKAFTKLPDDLYIPPDALEVFLEAFEGPLDLLLYLIRRQNLDILDIPVAEITKQYMTYVEMMRSLNMELAAEYLVMAAMLGEIKSRYLLPRPKTEDGAEEMDPRAELIRRLQEYERFKKAAADLDGMPQEGRDFWPVKVAGPDYSREKPVPQVDLREILLALQDVIRRADLFESHNVSRETLTLREKMGQVLEILKGREFVPFVALFTLEEGRLGVVVTFMAILEMVKEGIISLVQTEAFGQIHVKARAPEVHGDGYDLAELQDDGSDDAYEAPADEAPETQPDLGYDIDELIDPPDDDGQSPD
ncbi:MAG: excinuclease subunit [Moraxellaceae bacterium]|jgi:segregation and condensation protein A|nr:excinuclease subunit [Moraxellaceae bacterium]